MASAARLRAGPCRWAADLRARRARQPGGAAGPLKTRGIGIHAVTNTHGAVAEWASPQSRQRADAVSIGVAARARPIRSRAGRFGPHGIRPLRGAREGRPGTAAGRRCTPTPLFRVGRVLALASPHGSRARLTLWQAGILLAAPGRTNNSGRSSSVTVQVRSALSLRVCRPRTLVKGFVVNGRSVVGRRSENSGRDGLSRSASSNKDERASFLAAATLPDNLLSGS